MACGRPSKLAISVGGAVGHSFEVAADGENLTYRHYAEYYELEDEISIDPSDADWQAFAYELDGIGIWAWAPEYVTTDVLDGTNWSVEIEWGERRLESSGSNAYPPEGADDPTPEFERFCAAVQALVGGRDFY